MDDSVIRAMALWPDVPDCYGWLKLDARGIWCLQDQRISNQKVIDFIGRNFHKSEAGSYFFQNGPQRVHIELVTSPFVVFVPEVQYVKSVFENQLGERVSAIREVAITPEGSVYLGADSGCCSVDDRSLSAFLALLVDGAGIQLSEQALNESLELVLQGQVSGVFLPVTGGLLEVVPLASEDVESHFGFLRVPSELLS